MGEALGCSPGGVSRLRGASGGMGAAVHVSLGGQGKGGGAKGGATEHAHTHTGHRTPKGCGHTRRRNVSAQAGRRLEGGAAAGAD
eukprot:1816185-Pleurochrysis_carterae.AAC.1